MTPAHPTRPTWTVHARRCALPADCAETPHLAHMIVGGVFALIMGIVACVLVSGPGCGAADCQHCQPRGVECCLQKPAKHSWQLLHTMATTLAPLLEQQGATLQIQEDARACGERGACLYKRAHTHVCVLPVPLVSCACSLCRHHLAEAFG